ncbi:lyase family protein [Actinacidiphila acididurans]|uniref:lyase family protein n=1 Tax=Actinacidiphila acididurans TaxID=2784346 RepID=UPI00355889C8
MAAGEAVWGVTGDRAVLQAMLDAEAGLVRAQYRVGVAPRGAAEAVTGAARAERFDARSLAVRAAGAGGNPVIPLVADLTREVERRDADAASYVHRGATSQDILDSALMLVAARTLDLITAELRATAAALGEHAARHRGTVLPGRTLTQHAVPTTFGLKSAGWRSLVLDAHDRLLGVRTALPAQLGGAAGTLAAFHVHAAHAAGPRRGPTDGPSNGSAGGRPSEPADGPTGDAASGAYSAPVLRGDGRGDDPGLTLAAAYAAELGLAEPELPWHVLRTPIADLAGALAFCAGALGKVAADVLVLSRTEITEVAEGSGGGSSAMPHKANPARATLIASAARQVPALAAVLFGAMAAEDERPAGAWHAEWHPLREALRLTGGAARTARDLCEGLTVFPGRMRDHLGLTGGTLLAEHVTAHLTPVLGRAVARAAVATASRRAAADGSGLAAALARDPAVAALLDAAALAALTDPAGYLGSAPALTDRALRRTPARASGGRPIPPEPGEETRG